MSDESTKQSFDTYLNARRAPASMDAAQQKVRQAAERRAIEEDRLVALYGQLDHITGWNLATWLPRITGRIRDRQSKVTDTILQQHAVRDRAVAEHEAALAEMLGAQASIDNLPLAREAAVAAMTGPGVTEAQELLSESKRLSEALAAAGRAQAVAANMQGDLNSAEVWSVHDTYLGGGIASTAMKQDRIYQANDMGAALTGELTTLRKTLQELNFPTSYFQVQMNDTLASSDLFVDNIVSDFAIARRISGAQDRLQRLQLGLVEVSTKLGEKHKAVLAHIDQLLDAEIKATPAPPASPNAR